MGADSDAADSVVNGMSTIEAVHVVHQRLTPEQISSVRQALQKMLREGGRSTVRS